MGVCLTLGDHWHLTCQSLLNTIRELMSDDRSTGLTGYLSTGGLHCYCAGSGPVTERLGLPETGR